jgi:hypothetical protein
MLATASQKWKAGAPASACADDCHSAMKGGSGVEAAAGVLDGADVGTVDGVGGAVGEGSAAGPAALLLQAEISTAPARIRPMVCLRIDPIQCISSNRLRETRLAGRIVFRMESMLKPFASQGPVQVGEKNRAACVGSPVDLACYVGRITGRGPASWRQAAPWCSSGCGRPCSYLHAR